MTAPSTEVGKDLSCVCIRRYIALTCPSLTLMQLFIPSNPSVFLLQNSASSTFSSNTETQHQELPTQRAIIPISKTHHQQELSNFLLFARLPNLKYNKSSKILPSTVTLLYVCSSFSTDFKGRHKALDRTRSMKLSLNSS